jgi:hypothetical protein
MRFEQTLKRSEGTSSTAIWRKDLQEERATQVKRPEQEQVWTRYAELAMSV